MPARAVMSSARAQSLVGKRHEPRQRFSPVRNQSLTVTLPLAGSATLKVVARA